MERLLARLERPLGRLAIPNLITFIVGGMAIVWVLSQVRPDFPSHLYLDLAAVRRGEIWRLITFVFIPPPSSNLWILLNLYFTWWVGSSLEQNWGAFKFNAYYAVGILATIAAAALAGPMSNTSLDGSLFLAFATMFPNVEVMLLFIIPVRVKWLGMLAALAFAYFFVRGGGSTRAEIAAALLTYGLFFIEYGWKATRDRRLVTHQRARRVPLEPNEPVFGHVPVFGHRACALCGAREDDGVDIRVCTCEKCGGKPRALCLVHARSH